MSRLVVTNIETQNIMFDSDTTAFTIASDGNVSGNGLAMSKISESVGTNVAQFDITGFSETYDTYYISFDAVAANDNIQFFAKMFVGGTLITANHFGFEVVTKGSSPSVSEGDDIFIRFERYGTGNAAGEGITGGFHIYNRNSSTRPTSAAGSCNGLSGSANHDHLSFGGIQKPAYVGNVMSGIRLYFASGNIAAGTVKLYGIK